MTTRVGRTLVSNTGRPVMTTGSAYSAWDNVGAPVELKYAAGVDGGLIGQFNVLDLGTSNAALLFHFYSTAPSFVTGADGDTWTLHLADLPYYCGSIAVSATDWVSAGTARNRAQITNQNIAIQGLNGSRSVWVQPQTPAIFTANSTANPLIFNATVLQD